MLLDVTILGEPVGQGRPRTVRIGPMVRIHPAKKSAEWEALAAQQMAAAWGARAPHAGPVELHVLVLCPRPKSTPKRSGVGRSWHTAKPDLDNVVKAVADALVKAGVLRDDVFVAALQARSYVAAADESPRVRLQVHELVPLEVVPAPVHARRASSKFQGHQTEPVDVDEAVPLSGLELVRVVEAVEVPLAVPGWER